MIRSGDILHNPVTGETVQHSPFGQRDRRRIRPHRSPGRARRVRCRDPRPPLSDREVRDPRGRGRIQGGRRHDRRRPRRDHRHRAGYLAPFLEFRRRACPLPLRGATRASVRATSRNHVRARSRRQDEPQGHAEPASAGRYRKASLRRRAAPVPARVAATRRVGPRLPGRSTPWLPRRLRGCGPAGGSPGSLIRRFTSEAG